MKDGFIKVAAATPVLRLADCAFNADAVIALIEENAARGAKVIVFPELCLTGYTAGDLFFQETLLDGALAALQKIKNHSKKTDALIFVGLPLRLNGRIYNAAAALCKGEILAVVPKTVLVDVGGLDENRRFSPAPQKMLKIMLLGEICLFGTDIIFRCSSMPEFAVAAEICADISSPFPPAARHAAAGANIIVNLSASPELIGKAEYRRALVSGQSARLIAGYVLANAGDGESTGETVFAGHNIIAENGKILKESELFNNGSILSEIDVAYLASERSKRANFGEERSEHTEIYFDTTQSETTLTRDYPKLPFIPSEVKGENSELILTMLSKALVKRMEASGSSKLIIGISGGLDSALCVLAACRALKLIGKPQTDILGITMPCFGTSKRTFNNSKALGTALGISFSTIDITDAVTLHLNDINYSEKGSAYENAQARERTQVLMDIANKEGGIVLGTGDLSEAALGWCTFNGDHMAMYAVNSSISKTLVKHLVRYEADKLGGEIQKILLDIIDTPVSPELLPGAQNTEDSVGPYELVDFFLYHTVGSGFKPSKIYRLAKYVFDGVYDGATIKKWLTVFVRRFFSMQFKRNCSPEGIKMGAVSLSPRSDWRMPSDASAAMWLEEAKN